MPLLAARNLTKSFPGVRALKGVSLTLARGEVLAVIGENGAGKSTLMKILAGVQTADAGEILLDDLPVAIRSVHDALAHGIALIHQELDLADNLDVAANIFLGREPRRFGWIDAAQTHREAGKFLAAVGLEREPSLDDVRDDRDATRYIFCGMDGTILLSEPLLLHRHGLEVCERDLQVLPGWLRRFPADYTAIQRIALRLLRGFRRLRRTAGKRW